MLPTVLKVLKTWIKEALEKNDPVANRLVLEKIVNYINDFMGWKDE